MGDCDETLRELEVFLDGELGADVSVAIRGHLEGCPNCLEAFDFHAELRAVIATRCREEMPPGLLARLETCLQTDLDDDGRIG